MIWKTNSFNESWVLSLIITLLLAILILGEILHIQSLLYYSVGFGASSALFTLIAPHIEIQMFHGSQEGLWKIFITSGFAAGFVYWLVAGRSA